MVLQKCQRIKLVAGDVLYLPAGTIHMAWSSGTAHSLHATIGIARTHHGHSWAGLLQSVAGIATPSKLLREPRLHVLPAALARTDPTGSGDGNSSSGVYNTAKCMLDIDDVPRGFYDSLAAEYDAEIRKVVLGKDGGGARVATQLESKPKLREWLSSSRSMMHKSALPVGLQFDVSTFPQHSPATKGWEEERKRLLTRTALSVDQLASGKFVRTPAVMMDL
eukprot:SAG22_NODE_6213_length_885_cov_0.896947_1_plen_220_part_10